MKLEKTTHWAEQPISLTDHSVSLFLATIRDQTETELRLLYGPTKEEVSMALAVAMKSHEELKNIIDDAILIYNNLLE